MEAFAVRRLVGLLIVGLTTTTQASYPYFPLPVRYIHQWSLPTYVQSLYVRSNGDILATTVWPNASIYALTNVSTDNPTVSLIHTFEQINAVTGIIETQPDVFAFMGGNQSSLGVGIDGTFGIWELDLQPSQGAYSGDVSIREIVHMSDAGLIGSFDMLPNDPTTLLVADTMMGVVWRVDTIACTYELAIQDKHMEWLPWFITQFGISGLKIQGGYLYWSLSYTATIWRIPITDSGSALDNAKSEEVKWIRSVFMDNFAFGPRGNNTIWAALNADNRLIAITPDGDPTYVVGFPDEMILVGPVAPAFGKAEGDTNTIYVCTNGGMLNPVNGTIVEGGRIVAIDTTAFFRNRVSAAPHEETELR